MNTRPRRVTDWLHSDSPPGNYYALLGARLFEPDLVELRRRTGIANRELFAYQNHADQQIAIRATALLNEIGRAAATFTSEATAAGYNDTIIQAFADQYSRTNAGSLIEPESVRAWLASSKSVSNGSLAIATTRIVELLERAEDVVELELVAESEPTQDGEGLTPWFVQADDSSSRSVVHRTIRKQRQRPSQGLQIGLAFTAFFAVAAVIAFLFTQGRQERAVVSRESIVVSTLPESSDSAPQMNPNRRLVVSFENRTARVIQLRINPPGITHNCEPGWESPREIIEVDADRQVVVSIPGTKDSFLVREDGHYAVNDFGGIQVFERRDRIELSGDSISQPSLVGLTEANFAKVVQLQKTLGYEPFVMRIYENNRRANYDIEFAPRAGVEFFVEHDLSDRAYQDRKRQYSELFHDSRLIADRMIHVVKWAKSPVGSADVDQGSRSYGSRSDPD